MSTQNKIVTEKEFCGQWVLLYFGYSFSPDVGPEQLKMMSTAVHRLGLTQIKARAIFISLYEYDLLATNHVLS